MVYIIQWNIIQPKKEILPFGTTWMDLNYTMLSEITQRNTIIVRSYLYMESKKAKLIDTDGRWWPVASSRENREILV